MHTEDNINMYMKNVFAEKYERKGQIKRSGSRCHCKIKVDFKEVKFQGLGWIHPVERRV
jgi:hypothetical protein